MKRIGTALLLFSCVAISAHGQTTNRHTISAKTTVSTPAKANPAALTNPKNIPTSVEEPLATKVDTISYVEDTTNGLWTIVDPLNQLPNTPNSPNDPNDPNDSLPASWSVDQFGPITINGTTIQDTLYKRVLALRVSIPDDISLSSARLDSVAITFVPFAWDSRDTLRVWAVPIFDAQTQSNNVYPFIDLFSSTRTSSGKGSPYATGKIAPSSATLNQLNTVTASFGKGGKAISNQSNSQFAIAVFDDGPGFLKDSIAFQFDFSQDQSSQIDTDGLLNGGPAMRTYYAVLDGGTDYVDPNTGGTDYITNGVSGFLTGIYTVPGDPNNDFLGNVVMNTYMHGTALSGVGPTRENLNNLEGNFPNPVSNQTLINYNLAVSGPVTIQIYNQLGEVVGTVLNTTEPAGPHSLLFNVGTIPDGMYYCKLQAGTFNATKTMVIAR